jgi:ubiquinone/menaquinone biosynthesis C-methylase UbiE
MTPTTTPALPPNHHADHPGFAGLGGIIAALTFSVGRTAAADLAIELTGAGAASRVVDIGCGPGVAVRRVVARGASSGVGIDPAAVMLRVARAVGWASRGRAGSIAYLDGTAEGLPLPDDSATVAWSLATVHHWRDIDAGLAEVRRVLAPGGCFLAIERLVEPGATGIASHGWTEPQAERFAEQCRAAGFTEVEVGRHHAGRRGRVLSVLARRV